MEQTNNMSEDSSIHHTITILVAEPSPFLAQKILDILSHDETVLWVFHVSRRTQLLREAAKLHPDFILADLRILKTSQTVDSLRRVTPHSRIIALTESESAPYVRVTTKLGLDGMIEKGRIGRDDLNQILGLSADKDTCRQICSVKKTNKR
ncbi:MAG: response regulator transcription factor [Proteobacteria bacterium]|nr:response regulator transcription factor [Pseudomonadota bacterium]